MELPFTVVFEPPSRAELRAVLSLRRVWVAGAVLALAIGAAIVCIGQVRTDVLASGPTVTLRVVSHPAGASAWLDERERGPTPIELPVAAGPHSVTLKARDALDSRFDLQVGAAGAALDVALLRRQPRLVHLRPTLPGAELSDVRLLADGRLALVVTVRSGELEAWRLDPLRGTLEPLLTNVTATRLAVAPDGQHIAYLGAQIGPLPNTAAATLAGGAGPPLPGIVWLVREPFGSPFAGWRPPAGETLLDLSWSPDADGLLVVTGRAHTDGPPATHLWWLDAAGERAWELQALPSLVVPGSEEWSLDGQHLAFLAHAGRLTALCVLGLNDGTFRYLADLAPSDAPPLPYAPVGWSADGQAVLFTAPRDQPSGTFIGWLQSGPGNGLFLARAAEPVPTLLAEVDVGLPGWQADGRVLGLGRPDANGPLALQLLVERSNSLQRLVELPMRPHRGYAVAWNSAHTRVLIADPAPSGGIDYWVAVLELEDAS